MNSELNQYIENLDQMVRKLSASETRQLLQQLGRQLRQNNKKRIQANVTPSGAPMFRRHSIAVEPLKTLRKEQDFIYHDKIRRYRTMRDKGSYFVGYEYYRKGIMTADKSDVMKAAKLQIMFRKIHQYKYLKLKSDSHEAAIGFLNGLVGYIAHAHQEGEDNRPERTLLGFSDDDLQLIENRLQRYFQAV